MDLNRAPPEIIFFFKLKDSVFCNSYLIMPYIKRFIIIYIY